MSAINVCSCRILDHVSDHRHGGFHIDLRVLCSRVNVLGDQGGDIYGADQLRGKELL
jgi:hypothetical protein